MLFRFAFKHMKSSEALQEYAKNKINTEVLKFSTKPIEAYVTFSVDKHNHQVTCAISGGDGFSFNVEHVCDDMYGSIDHLIDKLSSQLKKHKDKLKDHKFPKNREMFASTETDYEYANVEVDASDILKFENSLRRKMG
ncbi:MAG: ribosome-associated translation inhibitor RaiA [Chitinophagaceae bacterium]|nr:ribosome-associated translation inhibitor RaiA [Oligoflexus sp.]